MAYVNVLDWKAEQVADWLRGLEDTVYPYAHFFLNNDVTGQVAEHTILDLPVNCHCHCHCHLPNLVRWTKG